MTSTLRAACILALVLLGSGCSSSEEVGPATLESDVFIDRYCGSLRDMCWRYSIDIRSAPPDTDLSVCAETLRALSKAPGTSFDSRLAKACEAEDLWRVSFSCGGVFKVAQPRSAGSTCSVDAECANLGDAVGLCVASSAGRKCALVKRGKVGDACVGTSGSPLAARSTFEGAICMHQEGLFCDPTGRCSPRRGEGESCRRDPREVGSSVDCRDGLWCIDGSCVRHDPVHDRCPSPVQKFSGCGTPIGNSCSEQILAAVPTSDCLGVCVADRCTYRQANAKGAACMGFTTAHSFEF